MQYSTEKTPEKKTVVTTLAKYNGKSSDDSSRTGNMTNSQKVKHERRPIKNSEHANAIQQCTKDYTT